MPEPLVDTARMVPSGPLRAAYRLVQPALEGALRLRAVNRFYNGLRGRDLRPAPFCEDVLERLGVAWEPSAPALDAWRAVPGPCVAVANHPLGGRDALALVCLLGRLRPDFRVMANFILGRVPEVKPGLILVDPFGGSGSTAANLGPLREARRWLGQGGLLGVFPAGEVSAWRDDEARIADKDWAAQTARLIQASRATVLPLRFPGRNRRRFYWGGRLHPLLRTLQLPAELMDGPCADLRPVLGDPIPFEQLPSLEPAALAAWLRGRVYGL